jgi:hypothetical protein
MKLPLYRENRAWVGHGLIMWLLQYNPVHSLGDNWPVRRYRDRIAAGDEVALWASGRDGGVTGLGVVAARTNSTIEISDVRTFPVISRRLLKADPRFAGALILRMPGGGNPFPLDPDEWQAITDHVPPELHLVGKTVLGAAALAAAGATAIREAVKSVTRAR